MALELGRFASGVARLTACTFVVACAQAIADVPDTQRAEVEHLLGFIRTSSCELVRNGREYDGERAYRHVVRKYDYFRDEIASTEEFIALAATKSELSGRAYEFRCDGQPTTTSAAVLLEELARFRASAAGHDQP